MATEEKDSTLTPPDVHHVEEMRSPPLAAAPQDSAAYADPVQRLNIRGILVMMVSDHCFLPACYD